VIRMCLACGKGFIKEATDWPNIFAKRMYCSLKCSWLIQPKLYALTLSEESKRKIGDSKKAENNASWKGDNVKYRALHSRIAKLLPKPDKCSGCNRNNIRLCLTNNSGKYLLDLYEWEWLCYFCHATKDGRRGITHPWYNQKHKAESIIKMSIAANNRHHPTNAALGVNKEVLNQ
jgi:hypothetical protein